METKTQEKGYNGWTNYETWNCALWIDNEQGSSEYWRERAEEALSNTQADENFTHEENAAYELSKELQESFEENNPLPDAGFYTDLLNAAIREVNWFEIAKNILEEAA